MLWLEVRREQPQNFRNKHCKNVEKMNEKSKLIVKTTLNQLS